jgi:hypothetical protein
MKFGKSRDIDDIISLAVSLISIGFEAPVMLAGPPARQVTVYSIIKCCYCALTHKTINGKMEQLRDNAYGPVIYELQLIGFLPQSTTRDLYNVWYSSQCHAHYIVERLRNMELSASSADNWSYPFTRPTGI